ncbi:cytochrome c [Campylobacter sp. faydin G-24]|uniref:Cytochrome c n=1 Tax=Campylobacter anatolicus TaxID=2829105 RepID=A0ABS5HK86_9BACT|nr:cytochrome c [Campylobacter anatolicus]MBR8462648.1 cytochrome c [Campylobacter anatolicus]MBR8464552.1 cytochrome c [Campylobacter anatolicus]MBR8465760.1 cytochrome c [Campylobacter anatolicus]
MKVLKISFLASLFVASAFSASQVYYIQAYGDFGKELADMAQKYADEKNQKISISVDEDPRRYKDNRILKIGVDHKGRYSVSLGAELYAKKCASCHGDDASKKPYGSTALKDISAQDIEDSVVSYRSDPSFGGSGKIIMQNEAKFLSNNDLGAIIAFLKGKNALVEQDKSENKPVSTEKKQGSYLR